ncbi:MAG: hypothetical protein GF350_09040, partial [Chitinivibrionales bacterium]|nr:hypothetical protein [Chitinivibrionales bacterium]
HLSTQTGVFNSLSMEFWARQGVDRIILPRECTIDQVRNLSQNSSIETELFIHGAMCMSISGRCLIGAYMEGRHPNFGDCPQPCRLAYKIAGIHDKPGYSEEWMTVEEAGSTAYILNSRDLNTIPIFDTIISSGVASLKIEGRNKSIHYVSSVVKVYREAIDTFIAAPDNYSPRPHWTRELDHLDHRPYTTGFYGGDYSLQEIHSSKAHSIIRVVGIVRERLDSTVAVVEVKNPFKAGETLSILPSKPGRNPFDVTICSISDLRSNSLDRAVTGKLAVVSSEVKLNIGDMLRRKK